VSINLSIDLKFAFTGACHIKLASFFQVLNSNELHTQLTISANQFLAKLSLSYHFAHNQLSFIDCNNDASSSEFSISFN
jgi:hypothetical protein